MISSLKDTLPTMLALAREHTELSRVQLACMLADVFMDKSIHLTSKEEAQLNDLMDVLMFNCSPNVRTELLKKFVDVDSMPRRMVRNLAQDNIDVARPILLTSPALSDDDLIHVVETKGGEHAATVASRAEISEAVADALVTTGDLRVMQVVVENLGAHLTPSAVDIVAEAARFSIQLRKPLLSRPEMHVDAALKLYWWVEQDLRRATIKRFGITAGQIDQALSKTIAGLLNDHVFEKSNDDVMIQIADWLEQHDALKKEILPQVLRLGHFRLFNMLLSRMARLSLALVDTITEEIGGRGLAAICRAVGIDKPMFVSLFLLSRGGRPGEQIVHPRELAHAIDAFDRMTASDAKDLLHSWSINPAYFLNHRKEAEAARSYA